MFDSECLKTTEMPLKVVQGHYEWRFSSVAIFPRHTVTTEIHRHTKRHLTVNLYLNPESYIVHVDPKL